MVQRFLGLKSPAEIVPLLLAAWVIVSALFSTCFFIIVGIEYSSFLGYQDFISFGLVILVLSFGGASLIYGLMYLRDEVLPHVQDLNSISRWPNTNFSQLPLTSKIGVVAINSLVFIGGVVIIYVLISSGFRVSGIFFLITIIIYVMTSVHAYQKRKILSLLQQAAIIYIPLALCMSCVLGFIFAEGKMNYSKNIIKEPQKKFYSYIFGLDKKEKCEFASFIKISNGYLVFKNKKASFIKNDDVTAIISNKSLPSHKNFNTCYLWSGHLKDLN